MDMVAADVTSQVSAVAMMPDDRITRFLQDAE
jgi:hypothetical protein